MSRASRWVSCGALVAVIAATPSIALADDGPIEALGRMMNDSPTLTLVTTGVVVVADAGMTTLDTRDALRGSTTERGYYGLELAVAAPQALGFSLAPFYFRISRWSPVENLLLLLPAQAWSASLATHGAWSLASTSLTPNARLGVSFLVGVDWALSVTALGSASWDEWSPLEVGVVETGVGVAEGVFAFVRAAGDGDHTGQWLVLGSWSTLLLTHGVLSLVEHDDDGSSGGPVDARVTGPFASPVEGGAVGGVSGIF